MKIAIVNNLPAAVKAIRHALALSDRHQVAWVAGDGEEAVKKCAHDKPDLILMDMVLPVLNGVEATRQIMAKSPCAILIVTATVSGTTSKVFEALGAGAIDAVNTPGIDTNTPESPATLLNKIDMVEKLIFNTSREKNIAHNDRPAQAAGKPEKTASWPSALPREAPWRWPKSWAVCQKIFPPRSSSSSTSMPNSRPGLAEWLNAHSTLPVRVARQGRNTREGNRAGGRKKRSPRLHRHPHPRLHPQPGRLRLPPLRRRLF